MTTFKKRFSSFKGISDSDSNAAELKDKFMMSMKIAVIIDEQGISHEEAAVAANLDVLVIQSIIEGEVDDIPFVALQNVLEQVTNASPPSVARPKVGSF